MYKIDKPVELETTSDKVITDITEILYKRISERISKRKKELNKKRYEIVELERESLFSHICNNKRYHKKNDYLLTPCITDEIKDGLDFSSNLSVIWGEEEERYSILKQLFNFGLEYLETSGSKELVHSLYKNFLPFARSVAYIDEESERFKDGGLDSFIDSGHEYLDMDLLFENMSRAKKRLYILLQEKFYQLHADYFENKYTVKIDKEIKTFYEEVLLKLLKEEAERDKRGENAYQLIRSILYDTCLSWLSLMGYNEESQIDKSQHDSILESSSKGKEYIDSIITSQEKFERDMFLVHEKI